MFINISNDKFSFLKVLRYDRQKQYAVELLKESSAGSPKKLLSNNNAQGDLEMKK